MLGWKMANGIIGGLFFGTLTTVFGVKRREQVCDAVVHSIEAIDLVHFL